MLIGKITGAHGVKGYVVFEHLLNDYNQFSAWDALMIELLPNGQIPYFIEDIKIQSNSQCLVKLEEINSPEAAQKVTQKNVYLSPNVKVSEDDLKVETDILIGYTIYDGDKKIGIIDNILNPKANALFILFENTEQETLIPANEELITMVDHEKSVVVMNLPEGLY